MRRKAKVLFAISLSSYVISFGLPAFAMVVDGKTVFEIGLAAFEAALMSIDDNPFTGGIGTFVVWLANPIFWVAAGLFLFGRFRSAMIADSLAILLGIRFVFAPLILIGYYVWLGSMALLLVACMSRPAQCNDCEQEVRALPATDELLTTD